MSIENMHMISPRGAIRLFHPFAFGTSPKVGEERNSKGKSLFQNLIETIYCIILSLPLGETSTTSAPMGRHILAQYGAKRSAGLRAKTILSPGKKMYITHKHSSDDYGTLGYFTIFDNETSYLINQNTCNYKVSELFI